jgi:hypothetical protein
LTFSAATSGGSVHVEGLPVDPGSRHRARVSGTLNGGAGRLRANTSGGGITLRVADDPGVTSRTASPRRAGDRERSARR